MRNLRFFDLWEQHGYHVAPVHFYQPTPDTRKLTDDVWARDAELVGVNMNDEGQLELLDLFERQYKDEYETFPADKTDVDHEYYLNQDMFRCVDAEILYCMIRQLKPKRILEIGSGLSTCLAAQAVCRNEPEGSPCRLVAIEPHPRPVLKKGFAGLSGLIAKPVQQVPLSEFEALQANDILFIDSSHVLAIANDVQYEYLEIVPRLANGVAVHIHDIFMPSEYPREWVIGKRRFWNEQYLLQAFLAFNDSFKVLWASSYMHNKHPDRLSAAFGSYMGAERVPVSFWMQRCK